MKGMNNLRISMQDIKVDYQNIIKRSERDKFQAYFWGLLIMILLVIENIFHIILNVDMFPLIILTSIAGLLINVNIYIRIRGNNELKNLIATATYNNIDLERLLDMNQDELKKIEWIKLNKSEYVLDYIRLGMCVYVCVALCFPSVLLKVFN
ncbi:TPA: hypothetical protein PF714_002609 [Staphylococcus aureus]|nr:hypothetical protein [Staphylococcus aureus]NDP30631.1 hypothetical protein [Staphylococcus aureus]NDP32235.1 hypothetical protein [Staphylococcus aureus]NDP96225.1 hypothetical protein [Staphylococcus aureus]NDQ09294.1 hypothetical protein [Staphylococcus aureus]NDQ17930.1 hypothetical protein [Staphylococcus aureus]